MAKDKTFLEFVEDFRLPMFPDEFQFSTRVGLQPGGSATFKNKKGVLVDEFSFGSYFPIDNGEEPGTRYYRKRVGVDRSEAGMYFFYRAAVRKGAVKEDKGFTPYPPPSKKQLIKAENSGWDF